MKKFEKKDNAKIFSYHYRICQKNEINEKETDENSHENNEQKSLR